MIAPSSIVSASSAKPSSGALEPVGEVVGAGRPNDVGELRYHTGEHRTPASIIQPDCGAPARRHQPQRDYAPFAWTRRHLTGKPGSGGTPDPRNQAVSVQHAEQNGRSWDSTSSPGSGASPI